MAALALLLTGCGGQGLTPSGNAIGSYEVALPDGRTVICVSAGPSISCDWENAR